ncbi:hypothetical protein [Demequina capsici]|uniref:Uncharacterized protein n=1 Tax=Demequina capsici TaxID=3075620 RepID=A0AA96JA92_9MICO|nr:hypothetical protein [Demequina sp. OYTSA14]WNM24391.1 hypothetical protein RN606_13660 [Demequina sp. OYTSA14]
MRFEFSDIDDSALDPETAELEGSVLRIRGHVRWDGIAGKRSRTVRLDTSIDLELRVFPVKGFRFCGLARGTGEFIAGEFIATDAKGIIHGVLPGDLEVTASSTPEAWFVCASVVDDKGVLTVK